MQGSQPPCPKAWEKSQAVEALRRATGVGAAWIPRGASFQRAAAERGRFRVPKIRCCLAEGNRRASTLSVPIRRADS